MSNQALDDLDSVMPFAPTKGRLPVTEIARAAARSGTYNNIHITNSNVGVVSTGDLARIDAAITISEGTEAEEFGARLKDLTDAILNDVASGAQLRQQMIEILRAISDQAVSKAPSDTVTSTLIDRLKELASNSAVIAGAVEKLHAAWSSLRSVLGGP